jgi:hypothetical protein
MKPRHLLIATLATVVLLLAAWFAWRAASTPASAPAAAARPSPTPAIAEIAQPTPGLPMQPRAATPTPALASAPAWPSQHHAPAFAAAAPAPGNPGAERARAMVELEKVHSMIASYHTLMGQNPVGTNAEIMKALMGGNPHQAILGPPPGQSLNGKGELLDPWGTPYFFHQISGDDMQIHSAGPDKIMGTADDLVIP